MQKGNFISVMLSLRLEVKMQILNSNANTAYVAYFELPRYTILLRYSALQANAKFSTIFANVASAWQHAAHSNC